MSEVLDTFLSLLQAASWMTLLCYHHSSFCAPMADVVAAAISIATNTITAATAISTLLQQLLLMQLLRHCQYTATTSATHCHHHCCSLPRTTEQTELPVWKGDHLEQTKKQQNKQQQQTTTTKDKKKQAHYVLHEVHMVPFPILLKLVIFILL